MGPSPLAINARDQLLQGGVAMTQSWKASVMDLSLASRMPGMSKLCPSPSPLRLRSTRSSSSFVRKPVAFENRANSSRRNGSIPAFLSLPPP